MTDLPFQYEAVGRDGLTMKGQVAAPDEAAAVRRLSADGLTVLKIAPAAGLILLGCEVLYFAARPQRWKYDFLSVFLCIVLMVSAFGGACLMAAFDFALHREEFWIEYDARQERGLNDAESDRLRLDLDEGTGPDLDEENEDSGAASHTEV